MVGVGGEMPVRKDMLVEDGLYHVFNKSIAGFKIFNNRDEFKRILEVICYYQNVNQSIEYSRFVRDEKNAQFCVSKPDEKFVEVIAYCIMPTHLHLILKQVKKNGISVFMGNVQNSYSRYFNIKHKRKGPLWEGRFKNVLIKDDEYLLHLTRYIHLNPVSAGIVDRPEDWLDSSYVEYLGKTKDRICSYEDLLDLDSVSYKEFVEDRISYQRELEKIKSLVLE
jgi:putative transposase